MGLSEKQIEDVFEVFYQQLISRDLKLVGRQYYLDGLFVDLLFRDSHGRNVILELKKDAIALEDVEQLLRYAGMIEDSRAILAAPIIPASIKAAFDHFGIEYLEFDLPELSRLYEQIKDKPRPREPGDQIIVPGSAIKEPLENRRPKDGNIAFKVTYVDSGWNGVCSPNLYEYNRARRVWCGIQAEYDVDCQAEAWKRPGALNEDSFPCYDSVALKILRFSPGVNHGPVRRDTVRRCLQAKRRKLALYTSRKPGEPESERFVFAVAQFTKYLDDERLRSEMFCCKRETALVFEPTEYPRFWKYYRNPNNPQRIVWGTGLFRYLTDDVVRTLLKDVAQGQDFTERQRSAAANLLSIVE